MVYKIVAFNGSLIASGLLAAALTALTVGFLPMWSAITIIIVSLIIDGLYDLLIYAGLHSILFSKNNVLFQIMKVQVQRWMFIPLFYATAAISQWLLLRGGVGVSLAVFVSLALAVMISRVAHTYYAIRTGLFAKL